MNRCLSLSSVAFLSILAASALPARAQSSAVLERSSHFVSAPSLPLSGAPTAIVSGDINNDGKLDLITADAASGKVTVSLGLGNGEFAAGVSFSAGDHPSALLLANLGNGGHLDLVVANAAAISVLSGNGDGSFQAPVAYPLSFRPALLAVGNFHGQGRADLIVTDAASAHIALLANDGQGRYAAPATQSVRTIPSALAVIPGASHADLALAYADGSVNILRGGAATLAAGSTIALANGPISALLAGDFNRDGNPDLAATIPGKQQLSVLLGSGDGHFAAPANYRVSSNPQSILAADFDDDGISDLIVANQGSNTFSLLHGNADGSFLAASDFVTGRGPIAAVAGDFDQDGHLDLALLNRDDATISIPRGTGSGSFAAARAYSVNQQPRSVAVADLTGSHRADLIVTSDCSSASSCTHGAASVLLAQEDGSYHLAASYPLGAAPVALALANLDGGKIPSILALNRADQTLSILPGLGNGAFQQQPITLSLPTSPIAFAIADLNHDGRPDLAILGDCGSDSCSQPGMLAILYGSASGFRSGPTYPLGYAPSSVAIADLNGDKQLDILVANRCGTSAACTASGTGSLFFGAAEERFTAGPSIDLGSSPSSIALADLGSRGAQDLIVTHSADNSITTLSGNGDGSFQPAVRYAAGATPNSIAVADFNGDGHLDVAVSNHTDATVSVFYGKGGGALASQSTLAVGAGPASLATLSASSRTHAGLVTANADASTPGAGDQVTILANLHPDALGTNSSTTTIVASPTSATVGGGVTLTATVTGDATNGAPTGSVSFVSTPDAISDCNGSTSNAVTPGTAGSTSTTFVCLTHALQAPSQTVAADYSGDNNYDVSSTNAASDATVTVAPYTTATLALSPSSSSTTVGSSVTFTASLTGLPTSGPATSGTVHFKINGVTDATTCPDEPISGTPACTTTTLTVGHGTVTATYSGDTNYTVSNTATSTVTVAANTSATLALTPSSSSIALGSSVTFTASLTGLPTGGPAASGTVHFLINGVANATACPDEPISGTPVCTTNTLTVGHGTVTATYSADTNYTVSNTATSTVTVTPDTSATLALTPSASSVTLGSAVTFTASLTGLPSGGPAASGTVHFLINGVADAVTCPDKLISGTPTCTTNTLTVGHGTVTATYSGDSNYTVSNTATSTVTVAPNASASLALSPSSTTINLNSPVTFTASLTGLPTGGPAASGTVHFLINGVANATACPDEPISGTPACTTSALTVGHGTVTATYSGDANYTVSNTATSTVTVHALTAALALSFSTNPTVGANVIVIVSIPSATVISPTAPTASPVFLVNGVAPGASGPLSECAALPFTPASFSWSCTTTFPKAQAYNITASYPSTDANFTLTAKSQSITINPSSALTLALVATPSPAYVNQAVTYTATLNPTTASPTPGGNITFTNTATGTQLSCSPAVVTANVATCVSTPSITSGSATIKAIYQGDGYYASGANATTSVTINADPTVTTVNSTFPSTSQVNQSVQFSASVTISSAVTNPTGGVNPQGTISFNATPSGGGAAIFVCTGIVSSSTATCNHTFTAAGTYTISANYKSSAEAQFSDSSSTTGPTQTVNAAGTTVTLTPTSNSIQVNQAMTFTANISYSNTAPTGTLTYIDNSVHSPSSPAGAVLCSVTLSTTTLSPEGAVQSCTASFNSAGQHAVTANYSGDSAYQAANSAVSSINVNPATVTFTTTNPSVTGASASTVDQLVTFSATVAQSASSFTPTPTSSAIYPDGSISFGYTKNGANITLCAAVVTATSTDTATCQAAYTAAGTYNVWIAYTAGAAGNFTSTSSTSVIPLHTVSKTPVTVAIASSQTAAAVYQALTFSATVTATGVSTTNLTLPTGTVTFQTDKGPLCTTSPIAADGTASCTVQSGLALAGPYQVTATYAGDTNFSTNTSTAQTLTVAPDPMTPAIQSDSANNTIIATQQVTYSASFAPTYQPPSGASLPAGVITFWVTPPGATLPVALNCSNAVTTTWVNGALNASCRYTSLSTEQGAYIVTANYTPSTGNFAAGTTNLTEAVQNFTLAVTPSSSAAIYVTQGYSTNPQTTSESADPFTGILNPSLSATITGIAGLTDSVSIDCILTLPDGNTATKKPGCSPASSFVNVTASAPTATTPAVGGFDFATTLATTPGSYQITLRATDTSATGLIHSSPTASGSNPYTGITLYVVPQAGEITLSAGFSGQETVNFPTPNTLTFAANACPNVLFTADITKPAWAKVSNSNITCTATSNGLVNGLTQASVTITTTGPGQSANVRQASLGHPGALAIAALGGVPLFGVLGLFSRRRRRVLRFFTLLLLLAGIGNAIACGGGGFNITPTKPGGTTYGSYLVQVTGTDSSGASYYAIVPLSVPAPSNTN